MTPSRPDSETLPGASPLSTNGHAAPTGNGAAANGHNGVAKEKLNGKAPQVLVEAPRAARRELTITELTTLQPIVARRVIHIDTERLFHVTDVTEDCHELVRDSGVKEGMLQVFTQHTTCAVKINERETCFLEDLRLFMEALVPQHAYYRHDDFEIRDPATLAGTVEEEPINGHAHIKQMLLGSASETVPVADGSLRLGTWQRVMFIELDQARPRRIQLQVQGWR